MRREDFFYELPEALIAKEPTAQRRDSRLLCLDGVSGACQDKAFEAILEFLEPGDLMIFNDTRVIPARIFAHKATGGRVEILVERVLEPDFVLAHVRASKSPKVGSRIVLEDQTEVTVVGRRDALFELRFSTGVNALDVLDQIGHMPLPPYIDRADAPSDRERYQTVYGKHLGAVAAPTAGLHFDERLLEQIRQRGVDVDFVTLHVGAGTFQPVRVDNIVDHPMHSEVMSVSLAVCDKVKATQKAGGRVIAVGTTSVRCLETAALQGELLPYQGDTNIFIYPGYSFKVVDCLLTNFHLPESTLLMLVSAFAGYRHTMAAYHHAVQNQYRFFSYGDAMFIQRNPLAPQEFFKTSHSE